MNSSLLVFSQNWIERRRRNAGRALGRGAPRICRLKSRRDGDGNRAAHYARDHLAHFKCPQRIQFVSELPKTATGKVQKYVLRGKPAISKQ